MRYRQDQHPPPPCSARLLDSEFTRAIFKKRRNTAEGQVKSVRTKRLFGWLQLYLEPLHSKTLDEVSSKWSWSCQ